MTTLDAAQDVSNRYGFSRQQVIYFKFRHGWYFTPILRLTFVKSRLPVPSPSPDGCITALSLGPAAATLITL
jgi:hypothetical protein